jgi:hypothetical protein
MTTNLVRTSGTAPAPSPAKDEEPAPTGEFRIQDGNSTLTLAPSGEPAWWWSLFVLPRAALVLLLWGTRSPDRGLFTAIMVGALIAAGLVLRSVT